METKYYGWIFGDEYGSVVKVVNKSEAYVFNVREKDYHRNDKYLKAMFDPGSEFEEITESEAAEVTKSLLDDTEEIEEV